MKKVMKKIFMTLIGAIIVFIASSLFNIIKIFFPTLLYAVITIVAGYFIGYLIFYENEENEE